MELKEQYALATLVGSERQPCIDTLLKPENAEKYGIPEWRALGTVIYRYRNLAPARTTFMGRRGASPIMATLYDFAREKYETDVYREAFESGWTFDEFLSDLDHEAIHLQCFRTRKMQFSRPEGMTDLRNVTIPQELREIMLDLGCYPVQFGYIKCGKRIVGERFLKNAVNAVDIAYSGLANFTRLDDPNIALIAKSIKKEFEEKYMGHIPRIMTANSANSHASVM